MPEPKRNVSKRTELCDGRIVLICCDNRNIEVEADGCITDPPYGIGYSRGDSPTNERRWDNDSLSISTVKKRFQRTIVGDDRPFDPTRYLQQYACCAFTGAQHFYHKLPPNGVLHCWNKRGGYKRLDQADADFIWINKPHEEGRQSRVFDLVWRGICRHSENTEKILHPTQKPIALMKWIIDLCDIQLGDRIYDPYMGVGTTGIAAIECGYQFIGVEYVEEYYISAVERITEYVNRKENARTKEIEKDPTSKEYAELRDRERSLLQSELKNKRKTGD